MAHESRLRIYGEAEADEALQRGYENGWTAKHLQWDAASARVLVLWERADQPSSQRDREPAYTWDADEFLDETRHTFGYGDATSPGHPDPFGVVAPRDPDAPTDFLPHEEHIRFIRASAALLHEVLRRKGLVPGALRIADMLTSTRQRGQVAAGRARRLHEAVAVQQVNLNVDEQGLLDALIEAATKPCYRSDHDRKLALLERVRGQVAAQT